MARTGRPPLDDVDRKEVTFRIRMTEEDRAAITAAALAAGKSDSEWAREMLLKMSIQNAGKTVSNKK